MPHKPRDPASFVTCRLCRRRFRAITVFHLRGVHKLEGEHPILDYKAEFDLAYSMCRDSRRRISEAKEDYWDDRGQHWTRDDLLAEVRRLHGAGKSLRGKLVPNRLNVAACRLLGSWRKAVEAAGFDYEQVTGVRHWSRERVIAEIRRLAAAHVPLDATTVQEQHSALHEAAIKLFPRSWAKALRAAGLDPDEHKLTRGVWNRREAEGWVRGQAAGAGSVVARDVPRDLLDFVRRRLELGWAGFVERVTGGPYPGSKKRWDWTQEKLLSEIRRLKAKGNPLTYRAVAAVSQSFIHQARRFFGSWDAARAAAGV
jgi:hypothetical protein